MLEYIVIGLFVVFVIAIIISAWCHTSEGDDDDSSFDPHSG